jgi:hypothetical protein
MAIVGLIGFAGSGKGTAADILVEKFGYHKLSFADALKDVTAILFGWDRALLEGDTKESREFRECPDRFWSKKFGKKFTPREALQKMGTEAGRMVFHKDLWIFTLERRLEKYPNVVIADVRFTNEIDFIRSKDGSIFRVKRGEEPAWYNAAAKVNRGAGGREPNAMEFYFPDIHYSEWAWIGTPADDLIHNDGSIRELEDKIRNALTLVQDQCNIVM